MVNNMEMKFIFALKNHDIYYIKSEYVSYYINIPKVFDSTNICVELKSNMNNYNLLKNNEKYVLQNVHTTYSFIDDYNITIVLPILNDELHAGLEKIDTSKYTAIEALLGQVINAAYMNLRSQGKNIGNKIILIDNERYKSFINWFYTRYRDRFVVNSLMRVIKSYNINATSYKKLETPSMTFVVGSYNNEVTAPKEVTTKVAYTEPKQETPKLVPRTATSGGFTSYWLLVAITILVSSTVAIISFFLK